MLSHGMPFLAAGPPDRIPYPAFSPPVQEVILRAITTAWEVVRSRAAARTVPRREVPITLDLQRELNRLLELDNDSGFTSSMFETVIRGGEIENVDATSPERRPDLTFRLAGATPPNTAREHYGMFAECKLIDERHSLRSYCDTGLRRFVECEYGWAMPHALMLAYALSSPEPTDLIGFLRGSTEYRTLGEPTLLSAPPVDRVQSIHDRHRNGVDAASGPVELIHVWLPLVPAPAAAISPA